MCSLAPLLPCRVCEASDSENNTKLPLSHFLEYLFFVLILLGHLHILGGREVFFLTYVD